jgi:hypothetical protein
LFLRWGRRVGLDNFAWADLQLIILLSLHPKYYFSQKRKL